MSSALYSGIGPGDLTPLAPTNLVPIESPRPHAPVRRVAQHRDPLKALAQLVADALTARLTDEEGQKMLRGLLGARTKRRERGLSTAKLIDKYLEHANGYYRHPDGTPTGETDSIRYALGVLRKTCGRTPAAEFRPLKLKAVREEMVKKGWYRKTINQNVSRIKRMFKWAVENELVPADRHHALAAVSGLKVGRTAAPESPGVKPAPMELVEAVLPHVSTQVAAMIRLQLLTGMRPGEVIIMRTADIDRSGEVWLYQPSRHKTAHHHHSRQVLLGPKAQEILRPFLKPDEPEAYLFSAAEAEAAWRRKKHAARKTPMNEGNKPGSNCKRRPRNRPGDKYGRHSYSRAISRACEVAFPVPPGIGEEETKRWRKDHHWHPHQLRHNAATELRKQFGLDAAQVILGHRSLDVTQVYAEKNLDAAIAIMRKVG